MTILAGVIGDPIVQSRSPKLHGYWLERYQIDGHYVPLHVRPDDLEATLTLLPRLGFQGVNVTLPHKEAVFALADERTERTLAVRAANTLTFVDGKIQADNTDGIGFVRSLKAGAPNWDPTRPAVILGAGGAARGIIAALQDCGVSNITITNRTLGRADALADHFGGNLRTVSMSGIEDSFGGCGLLVNTTSLGMSGHPPLDLDLASLPTDAVVTDIVYAPLETNLLSQARNRGNTVVDGLGMLLHQAAPGFQRWFGVEPQVDDALRKAVLA